MHQAKGSVVCKRDLVKVQRQQNGSSVRCQGQRRICRMSNKLRTNIAQPPLPSELRFYATKLEKKWTFYALVFTLQCEIFTLEYNNKTWHNSSSGSLKQNLSSRGVSFQNILQYIIRCSEEMQLKLQLRLISTQIEPIRENINIKLYVQTFVKRDATSFL